MNMTNRNILNLGAIAPGINNKTVEYFVDSTGITLTVCINVKAKSMHRIHVQIAGTAIQTLRRYAGMSKSGENRYVNAISLTAKVAWQHNMPFVMQKTYSKMLFTLQHASRKATMEALSDELTFLENFHSDTADFEIPGLCFPQQEIATMPF